jgi:Protein of unknown function (DUF3987)
VTTFDPRQVCEALGILGRHGGVIEVRILGTRKGTVSGYFNDLDALARAVAPWDGKASVYVTLNPVKPDLLARAVNRLREFAKETTADRDILRRAWLPIDCDPVRPKGISTTDEELTAAVARRNEIVTFLRELGFPAPFFGMSGNGGHVGYAIDLPNDAETDALIEQALKALGARFTDERVLLDERVFNAARIWKLYGTMACKGDSTPERPHRRAVIDSAPTTFEVVPPAVIQKLAAMAPRPSRTTASTNGARPGVGERLDLVGPFIARGLYKRALHDGKHAVVCPWASEHSGDSGVTESCLFEPKVMGDSWGFDCKHAHCAERNIKDVLAVLGLAGRNGHEGGSAAEPAPFLEPYAFAAPVPPGHFLADYIAYAAERTDAAHEFHEAAALVLLASATPGVKAKLRQYARGLATNLYVLIAGPSTGSRKSTAKNFARDVHDAVLPDAALADLTSPEGFLEQLARRSGQPSTWLIDEMGDLLDKLHHARHMAGLRGCLLSLYDGIDYRYVRHSKRTKAGTAVADEDWVRDPHLSLLGAATEAVFDTLTSADVTSGLLMRFAIVMPARKPARRPFEEGPPALADARDALARRLHALLAWATTGPRRVTFAPGALAHLDTFAATLEASGADLSERERAMLRRLDAMTIKLSMLVAAGRPETPDGDRLTVTLADASAAVTIAARWRADAVAFAGRIGETEHERQVERCLRVISGKPRVDRRDVAQRVHLAKRALDDVEATLQDRGLIRVEKIKAKGRPTRTLWQSLGGGDRA